MVNSAHIYRITPLSIDIALHFATVMVRNPLVEHLCDQSIVL